MLRRVLSAIASSPALYDAVQWLFGNRQLQARLAVPLARLPPGAWLIDVGGGTGRLSEANTEYVCLDLDPEKLRRFRRHAPRGRAVVGDATHCPLLTQSVDAALCAKVTHHLDDQQLIAMFAELARILRPAGTLILADAVQSTRWGARLLWQVDRGAHPRGESAIERALRSAFVVTSAERFRIGPFHDFVLYIAAPSTASRRVRQPD